MGSYELPYKEEYGIILKPSQILDVKITENDKGEQIFEVYFTRGDGGTGSIRCSDIPSYLKEYMNI